MESKLNVEEGREGEEQVEKVKRSMDWMSWWRQNKVPWGLLNSGREILDFALKTLEEGLL